MSVSANFGVTNMKPRVPAEAHSFPPFTNYDLDLSTSYGLKKDEPEVASVINRTGPVDQTELITFQCSDIAKINTLANPSHYTERKNNLMYGVRVDSVLRAYSDQDDTFTEDLPVTVTLSIKHPRNNLVSVDFVNQTISRLLSALCKDDGSSRVADLMRSCLVPTED